MKLLSFAIPCYNSAAYMEKCIKSCLAGGDDDADKEKEHEGEE